MIGKVKQNDNFRETTRYVLEKEKAKLLGGTVMGTDTDTISREFLMSNDLKAEIEHPVYHLMQSYSHADKANQDLSEEFQLARSIEHFAGLVVSSREPELLRAEDKTAYKQKVNEFIEWELYEYQWFVAAHGDRDHTHTHFVGCRKRLTDGRCIATWQDQERSQRVCRVIEQEHGLEQLPNSWEVERRKPTPGQIKKWEETGIAPVMVRLQDAIDQATVPGRSIEQMTEALQEQHGIQGVMTQYDQQRGVKFELDGVWMRGKQLGASYTYGALEARLDRELAVTDVEPTAAEEMPEHDPLAQVLREQEDYAQRIALQVQTLWQREQSGQSKRKVATFGAYEIRSGETEQPELYKGDRLLLAYEAGTYQGYGLSESDCTAIEQWNVIDQQKARDRLTQVEFQPQEPEQTQVKQKSTQSYSQDIER